jgi:hypothetical protein
MEQVNRKTALGRGCIGLFNGLHDKRSSRLTQAAPIEQNSYESLTTLWGFSTIRPYLLGAAKGFFAPPFVNHYRQCTQ